MFNTDQNTHTNTGVRTHTHTHTQTHTHTELTFIKTHKHIGATPPYVAAGYNQSPNNSFFAASSRTSVCVLICVGKRVCMSESVYLGLQNVCVC